MPPEIIKDQQAEGDGKEHDNPNHPSKEANIKRDLESQEEIKEWFELIYPTDNLHLGS